MMVARFTAIMDFNFARFSVQKTTVTHLPAGFSIKYCSVQNHHNLGIFNSRLYRLSCHIQSHHSSCIFQCIITAKFCATINTDGIAVVEIKLASRTRSGALLLHTCLITSHIEAIALFTRDIIGQISRETISIIELKN